MPEPFVLCASKRFVDRASKAFGLGFIVRKPLVEILRRMNVGFRELSRDEASAALDSIAESRGVTVTAGQLIKNLALALFAPTTLLMAAMKKVIYRSGVETERFLALEFLAEVPRAFRPSLLYDIWLFVPKTDDGEAEAKRLARSIVERVGVPPLTEEEWGDLRPVVEKLRKGGLEVRGTAENLWSTIL